MLIDADADDAISLMILFCCCRAAFSFDTDAMMPLAAFAAA